jgi:methionyl-tRNA synthetase
MEPRETAYVTTSIPYVNGRPHAGHALEYVQADAFARYRRQVGHRTRLQTGTDDNSLKNVLAAEREGLPVAALVGRNAQGFRELADALDVSYDGFICTSADPAHRAGVTALWRACAAAGAIYRRHYQGLYCVGCEQFYTPDELTPDGLCPEHLTRPELVEEENYFFRLSCYAGPLRALIASGALRIVPESRRNEVLSFIDQGLQDFSISRSQARARGWGIPVPDDPSQVMYVWFDALGNYITALGYGTEQDAAYRAFWAGDGERLHVIGKGILRFHAVYWPAMLLAAGLPTPTAVFVHGYLTVGGQKISKSLENAADPRDLIETYGVAALRWYLLREIHATADGDFSAARLVARYNNDLANDLGNLLNRANAMLHRYRGGIVPAPAAVSPLTGRVDTPSTVALLIEGLATLATELPARIEAAMDACDPRAALEAVWELVVQANRAVDEAAPWTLARAEKEGDPAAGAALDAVLYALLEAVRLIAVHLEPFLPAASHAILAQLGLSDAEKRPHSELGCWGGLPAGTHTAVPTPLFPRLEISNNDRRTIGLP